MKIQPLYNTNFEGIFKKKRAKKTQEAKHVEISAPKREEKSIKVGDYSFIETSDSRKFFAGYPRHLQESYAIKDNGFTVYSITRRDEKGVIRQMAQFVFDNVVITDCKNGQKESTYYKAGKREKSTIHNYKDEIIQRTIYSQHDDKIISEIDDYKKGKLSKTTFYYPQSQREVLFVAGMGISGTAYHIEQRKPEKVLSYDEEGNITNETLYYLNGSVKEEIEHNEDGGKKIKSYKQDGTPEQEEEYGPGNKIMSFSIFNGLGHVVEKLEFDKSERPIIKYLNNDMGEPKKIFEYDFETNCLITTKFGEDGLVSDIEAVNIDYPDFEELI